MYAVFTVPPVPLFTMESFTAFLDFARRHADEGRDILTHCNLGQSRAPSLAMLILAKVKGVIPDESFEEAVTTFRDLWPSYSPGQGITTFMARNWDEIR